MRSGLTTPSRSWSPTDFRRLVAALRYDNNLPAYCVLVALWTRLFGEPEPVLRLPSELFYLGGGVVLIRVEERRPPWDSAARRCYQEEWLRLI